MRTRFSAAVALLTLSLAGAAFAQAPAGPGGPPGAGGPPRGMGGPGGQGGPPGGGGGRGGGMGGMVISTTMLVESNSFPDGGIIPAKNAMTGGVQPDFKITGIPAAATSVVLIFHDIEIVGPLGPLDDNLHWMAWNIPVTNGTAVIEEGKLPAGAASGGGRGGAYMGPGAPAGVRYHHYVYDFFALNGKIDAPPADRPALVEAMKGKVVGKASYVGRFKGEGGAGGGRGPGGGAGGPPGGGMGGPPRGAGPGGPGAAPGGY